MEENQKLAALKTYFGYDSFRDGQEQIIDAILSGRDVMAVMPTGAGKSICYQLPALMSEGVSIVISPLISLMKDQVTALVQSGIRAAYLNSSLTFAQMNRAEGNMRQGMYKIIYVAPERLEMPSFLEACSHLNITLVTVDEAHCVSQWGQDFRPGYLKIADFIDKLPKRPTVAAFTATATDIVKRDVISALRLHEPFCLTTGFDRKNLRFEVRNARPSQKYDELREIISRYPDSCGIVYCSSRKNVEEVCERLQKDGYSAARYHAGLSDAERRQSQEDFIYDRIRIIVATNAFGMGIDKSDVAYVVHYNMPKDIESYYQEAGRAGRDGSPAECVMLFTPQDIMTAKYLIESSRDINPELTPEEAQTVYERALKRLNVMADYAGTPKCLRRYILNYFGEEAPDNCGNCSNCSGDMEKSDLTIPAQMILSCICRTGQRFGAALNKDVLRGSRSQKITDREFDKLSVFGLMKNVPRDTVNYYFSLLEDSGFIAVSPDEYKILSVTPKGMSFLKNREKFEVMIPKDKISAGKEHTSKSTAPSKEYAVDDKLMRLLKAERTKIANELRVPPYVVFSNATLIGICKIQPKSLGEMLNVPGIGEKKLEQFGKRFLQVITDYLNGADAPAEMVDAVSDNEKRQLLRKLEESVGAEKGAAEQIYSKGLSDRSLSTFKELQYEFAKLYFAREKLSVYDENITISEFILRISDEADSEISITKAASAVYGLFIGLGIVRREKNEENKTVYLPTDISEQNGIIFEEVISQNGTPYLSLRINKTAQQLILSNLGRLAIDPIG